MLNAILRQAGHFIITRARLLTSSALWKTKVTALAIAISLFTSFPSYDVFLSGGFNHTWTAVIRQSKHPFTPVAYEPASHESKLAFRLTVPVIAHLLRLNIIGLLCVQVASLALFFYFSSSLAHRASGDRVTASFAAFGLALTFPGNVLVSDLRGIFDGVAFTLMAISMHCTSRPGIMLFSLLAYFVDERAIVGSGLVLAWFILQSAHDERSRFGMASLVAPLPATVVASWAIYFAIRLILSYKFGLATGIGGGGISLLFHQLNNLALGAWTGLEGMWALVLSSLIVLSCSKPRPLLFIVLYCSAIVAVVAVAMSVVDITRSMGYVFPAIFISLAVLNGTERLSHLRLWALASSAACLFPTYYVDGKSNAMMFWPLPLQVMRFIRDAFPSA